MIMIILISVIIMCIYIYIYIYVYAYNVYVCPVCFFLGLLRVCDAAGGREAPHAGEARGDF